MAPGSSEPLYLRCLIIHSGAVPHNVMAERGSSSGDNIQGLETFPFSTDFIFCSSSIISSISASLKDMLVVCFFSSHIPFLSHSYKVSEIQKLDGQVKELVLKSSVEAERLVAGKLKKDTYIENEKMHSNKRQDLVTKIDNILDAL